MISAADIKSLGLTTDEVVKIVMDATGSDEITARFIASMELGLVPQSGDAEALKPGEKPNPYLSGEKTDLVSEA